MKKYSRKTRGHSLRSSVMPLSAFVFWLALAPYSAMAEPSSGKPSHWYTPAQVSQGKAIYQANCQRCHLSEASGTTQWKKRDADGAFPPPPLNGTAHAWHHSVEVLMKVIQEGGAEFGGKMPAFKEVLSEAEQLSVIAYFQSLWPDQVYQRWAQNNQKN